MTDTINKLYEVILSRRETAAENSYTAYLFREGLDKILKKVGEECTETVIAAKNSDNMLLCGEICDLVYHVLVLMAEKGLPLSDIEAELQERAKKLGNLKEKHQSDHNT